MTASDGQYGVAGRIRPCCRRWSQKSSEALPATRVGARPHATLRVQPAPGVAHLAHDGIDLPVRLPTQGRERAEGSHQGDHRHARALWLPPGARDAAPEGPCGQRQAGVSPVPRGRPVAATEAPQAQQGRTAQAAQTARARHQRNMEHGLRRRCAVRWAQVAHADGGRSVSTPVEISSRGSRPRAWASRCSTPARHGCCRSCTWPTAMAVWANGWRNWRGWTCSSWTTSASRRLPRTSETTCWSCSTTGWVLARRSSPASCR